MCLSAVLQTDLDELKGNDDKCFGGAGGGAGTGRGTGMGEGDGAGIGDGSGGGTGGGPYRAGSGIDPPRLLREVKAAYTDEARRANITGDVEMEITIRRDGSVRPPRTAGRRRCRRSRRSGRCWS